MEAQRQIPTHNLFGDHGPRCIPCSGLGRVLNLGTAGHSTKSTSPCTCKGTGIDQDILFQSRLLALEAKLNQSQSRIITLEKEAERLNRELMKKISLKDGRKPRIKNSRQYWEELISWATADGTAIANTTTEAIIFPNVTIPGNYMQDGRALSAQLYGRWSNVVTTTPSLTFAIRWGGVSGTVLAQSGAIVTPATATTNAIWSMEFSIQTRSNGATGTLFVVMKITMGEDAAPTFGTVTNYGVVSLGGSAGVATPAAVTVDLTADTALSVTADWSAASSSNTMTGHIYTLESMN